jgi:hypothetical protein
LGLNAAVGAGNKDLMLVSSKRPWSYLDANVWKRVFYMRVFRPVVHPQVSEQSNRNILYYFINTKQPIEVLVVSFSLIVGMHGAQNPF